MTALRRAVIWMVFFFFLLIVGIVLRYMMKAAGVGGFAPVVVDVWIAIWTVLFLLNLLFLPVTLFFFWDRVEGWLRQVLTGKQEGRGLLLLALLVLFLTDRIDEATLQVLLRELESREAKETHHDEPSQ